MAPSRFWEFNPIKTVYITLHHFEAVSGYSGVLQLGSRQAAGTAGVERWMGR